MDYDEHGNRNEKLRFPCFMMEEKHAEGSAKASAKKGCKKYQGSFGYAPFVVACFELVYAVDDERQDIYRDKNIDD